MIRREPIETRINHERWLVSYSDFITLLFAFFVVMYSVSQVNETRYRELSETLSQAFDGSPNDATPNEQASQSPVEIPELADLSEVQKQLENTLQGLVQQSRVSLSGNEDWVEIDINANLIFASAQAELSKEAETIFTQIADVLAPYDNAVQVSGHTDDIPISNAQFANNWELSSARAVSVVNWLAFNGVNPLRLSAVGYGEYRPVADNNTEAGRAKNRRVVLRVARERAEQPAQDVNALFSTASLSSEGETERAEAELTETDLTETDLTETESNEAAASEKGQSGQIEEETDKKIEPIKLDNGGLLFTNDQDSPRNRNKPN